MPRRKLFDLSTLTPHQLQQLSMASNRARTGHYPWLGQPLINYRSQIGPKMAPSEGTLITIVEPKKQRAPPSVGATAPPAQQTTKNKILGTNIMPTYVGDSRFSKKASYPVRKSATNRKNVTKKSLATRKSKTPTQALAKQVKDIQKSIAIVKSRHTYKKSLTTSLKSLIGRCNHSVHIGSTLALNELYSANLRFFDPATPQTLITANPNTGTYARDIMFKNVYMKISLRNNYQVPAKVKIYLCKPKVDQTNSILAVYQNALADQVINGGVDETDALIYVNDIERVKELWSIDCVVDRVLEPGQEASATHSTGPFNFDPSHIDLITDEYQKSFKAFEFLVRVEGVLGHDTTVATEQTIMLAGVDIQQIYKADIEYNSGGADLDDIYISEGRNQAFTNGGVVSLKPVADNIAYSIS